MSGAEMSAEQKLAFYRDGFVVLPSIVPEPLVKAARRRLFMDLGRGVRTRGTGGEFTGLFNDTDLIGVVEDALGPVRPIQACQLATKFPADPDDHVNEAGYVNRDTPFYAWHGHLDGLWNGATPIHQDVRTPMSAAARRAWHGEPSRNGCRKTFPELGANLMNFAALVAVALSDQTREGAGNVGVLRGAHHEMERFFRAQRDAGGPLGPDGPNWPRIDTEAPNGAGLRHYPDALREAFREGAAQTRDGKLWPRPTLLRLAPGDAAIVLHAVPHSATRVAGAEPRLMAYFRVTPKARPAANRAVYPAALCDIWHEWPGMADTLAALRSRAAR